jgi:integrase
VVLQLHHGLRGGEVLSLSWSDIDTKSGILHELHGQQRIGGRLIPRGKTKDQWWVWDHPISEVVLKILEAHKARQEADRKAWASLFDVAPVWNRDKLVFYEQRGNASPS